jgi:uncharacterized protein
MIYCHEYPYRDKIGAKMLRLICKKSRSGNLVPIVIRLLQLALVAPGAIIIEFAPALALDNSDANGGKRVPVTNFASGQEALRVAEQDLRAGKMEASVVALTYAAESGQGIARWKLGQMYGEGDGVTRDDVKAYHFFNELVESYDEDQPGLQNTRAISDAFVAVGVYCLNGIPNSEVRADPQRAHELFQAGHAASQALLGHMLFVGNGVADQRARGLMWLELAKDSAPNPQGQWIGDLYQRDLRDASDAERLAAGSMRDARAKGTSSPTARSTVTSLLQPFGVVPADR